MLSEEFQHLSFVELLDKLYWAKEDMLTALFVRKTNDAIMFANDEYALMYQKADSDFHEILESLKKNMALMFGE